MKKFKILFTFLIFISCSDDNEEISGDTGLFYQSTFFDGLSRDYILFVPDSYDENENTPIVITTS